jgi:CTP:molybdopterin cytidylyltransferase MocA
MSVNTHAIGSIVLAAGDSSRLGRPKQTIVFEGETLLDRAVRISRAAGAAETIVVVGAFVSEIRKACRLEACAVVENINWMNGMGTSIRLGIRSLRDVQGSLILTCDMPAVTAAHLQMLAATGNLMASLYDGKRGVPAYFPRAMFELLSRLEDDRGAGSLLSSADAIALAGGEFDVDTLEDVRRLEQLNKKSS